MSIFGLFWQVLLQRTESSAGGPCDVELCPRAQSVEGRPWVGSSCLLSPNFLLSSLATIFRVLGAGSRMSTLCSCSSRGWCTFPKFTQEGGTASCSLFSWGVGVLWLPTPSPPQEQSARQSQELTTNLTSSRWA